MSPAIAATIEALGRELERHGRVAVAVSGGIDSLTLATLAARTLGERAEMFHSLTASVPAAATERTRSLAGRFGWHLRVIDAREFSRDEYLANPVNRCFYCKQSLYAEIARHTDAQVLSGANTDDLSEYRPGLDAAREAGARHPFIDAGVGKATIRALARELGLGELSDLPASPCLSSRVETGIPIFAPTLRRIDAAEKAVRERIEARSVRCRVRAKGVVIEIDSASLESLAPAVREEVSRAVAEIFGSTGCPRSRRTGTAARSSRCHPPPAPSQGGGEMKEHDIKLDHEREQRIGFDEAIYAAGKSVAQLEAIIAHALDARAPRLFTRLDAFKFEALDARLPDGARFRSQSRAPPSSASARARRPPRRASPS